MDGWQSRTAVTLDVDWAPDYAIDHVAGLLAGSGVAATWFITHASPALTRLRERVDLFELGIHPNFLEGSTQGDTPEEVLDHCLSLVPEARSMRTHALVQSSPLLALVRQRTPVNVDSSLFLPRARAIEPVDYPLATGAMTRIPYLWEDDAEMYRSPPDWHPAALARAAEGLAVFCFHPIHVFLNSVAMEPYRSLRGASEDEAAARRHPGEGSGTAFTGLLDALTADGRARGARLSELAR
jgi:hypothetical protein